MAHTSMRPYVEGMRGIKETPKVQIDSGLYYYEFTQKLWKEHLFFLKGDDYFLTVDPLGNFRGGHDVSDTLRIMFRNSRALRVQGDLGDQFSFETFFYENQAKMPRYISQYIVENGALPSEGRVKKSDKSDVWDFGYAMGYISFSPRDNWNFQLGHGKQFVGNGYRSMILSDYAFSYPYLRSTWNFGGGKFQYSATYAQLSSLTRLPEATTPEATFERKFGNFHYLSFKPGTKLEIGLFEGALFKQYEDSVGTVPVHYSAYSPVLGTSLALNGFESTNNVVLGLNVSYNLAQKVQLYGQLVIDNPAESKLGYQVGIKAVNALGDRLSLQGARRLYLQLEVNSALPYTFATAAEDRNQAWSHMTAPLAHPFGASFTELIGIAYYEEQKFYGRLKINSGFIKGLEGGYENDISVPDEPDPAVVLEERKIFNNVQELELGHRFNVKTNLTGFVGVRNRVHAEHDRVSNSAFIYVGMRTNLNNLYYDF